MGFHVRLVRYLRHPIWGAGVIYAVVKFGRDEISFSNYIQLKLFNKKYTVCEHKK